MHRHYQKLMAIATNIGKEVIIGDPSAHDLTKSFFLDCYHLKDWLKKDRRIKNPQEVENNINSSLSLSLAADLCNSFKHAGLNSRSRSGVHLDKINMAYSLDLPLNPEPGKISIVNQPSDGDTVTISRSNRIGIAVATAKIFLTIGGKQYDGPALATQCINDWDNFLVGRGLEFSKNH